MSFFWLLYALSRLALAGDTATIRQEVYSCPGNPSYSVHLTFDDGPRIPQTLQILDTLKKEGIKATFFISASHFSGLLAGKATEQETALLEVLERMKQEGHTIGSHSFEHIEHANLITTPLDKVEENLDKNTKVLERLNLKMPLPFRFPYGSGWFEDNRAENKNQVFSVMQKIKQKGFYPVHWDVDSWDWSKIKNKALPSSILRQICSHKGGIVLMHDIHAFTASNLESIIQSIKKSGHSFVSLPEIMAENSSILTSKNLTSLKDHAAGINTCSRPKGDIDEVWPACSTYEKKSIDINKGNKTESAE